MRTTYDPHDEQEITDCMARILSGKGRFIWDTLRDSDLYGDAKDTNPPLLDDFVEKLGIVKVCRGPKHGAAQKEPMAYAKLTKEFMLQSVTDHHAFVKLRDGTVVLISFPYVTSAAGDDSKRITDWAVENMGLKDFIDEHRLEAFVWPRKCGWYMCGATVPMAFVRPEDRDRIIALIDEMRTWDT